jgi:predicted SprT family Zn-dependent metalloprotease
MVEQIAIFFHSIESVQDMILHELAHAIAGRAAGHGKEFRKVCKQIGCVGDKGTGNIYN